MSATRLDVILLSDGLVFDAVVLDSLVGGGRRGLTVAGGHDGGRGGECLVVAFRSKVYNRVVYVACEEEGARGKKEEQ